MVATQEYDLQLQQTPFRQENAPLGYQVDLNAQQYNNTNNNANEHHR